MEKKRKAAIARRISALYVYALLTVFYLYLPFGGYARMMEGKFNLFLLLTVPYVLSMFVLAGRSLLTRPTATELCAAGYLAATVLSALLSPYGSAVLLGGSRKDGLLTVVLYVLTFLFLCRFYRAGERLLPIIALCATLCDLLVLIQLMGRNPFWLYPAGLNYFDGDIAYAGFYAGVSGNIDFTAFLLALAAAVLTAAAIRKQSLPLLLPVVLTLTVLLKLGVAAALVGYGAATLFSLPFLFPRHRRAAWGLVSCTLAALLLFLLFYSGDNQTLREASALLHGEADVSFGSGRLAIWRSILPLVAARPLFGGGAGTLHLRGLPPFYWYREGGMVEVAVTSAHNEYLGILADQGLFALLFFLALLLLALRRCYQKAAQDRFALCGAALLCYGAMAFFSVSTCITTVYLWLLLAIIARRGK
ncbi:MAG: O-antigen ligase family protein [Oscillospiraceae bacterium]|nr:O-antigen ligase family protein [Oscillospiraceae bacterium]